MPHRLVESRTDESGFGIDMERWLEQTIDAEDALLNRTRQELPDVDRIPATPMERDDLAGGPLITKR